MSVKKNNQKRTILITGGLGFIGINLIQRLLRTTPHNIKILTREQNNLPKLPFSLRNKRIKLVIGDISDPRVVEKLIRDIGIIIHLAGIANISDINSLIKTNISGTALLLNATRNKKIEKIIFLSSSGVYAEGKSKIPFSEAHPTGPLNLYAASKLAAERIASFFYMTYKSPVVILRTFNVYGPYQTLDKPIPLFVTNLLKNKKIILNHKGKQIRDWVYVEDLASAIEKVISSPAKNVIRKVINVSTGKGFSIKEIASKIASRLKKNLNLLQYQRDGIPEPMYNVGDSKKIQNMLRWRPQYSIDEGLKKTIEWYKNYEN